MAPTTETGNGTALMVPLPAGTVAPQGGSATTISVDVAEAVFGRGDLGKLTPAQRTEYLLTTCRSLGLNPLTRPLQLLEMRPGVTTLYATRDATDQLRRLHGVSVQIVSRDVEEGVLIVTARATTRDGRTDESVGALPVAGLRGEALANCWMKAETKAKRRVTLSICGLGRLDESELETVPGADRPVEPETLRALNAVREALGLTADDFVAAVQQRYERGPRQLREHEARALLDELTARAEAATAAAEAVDAAFCEGEPEPGGDDDDAELDL